MRRSVIFMAGEKNSFSSLLLFNLATKASAKKASVNSQHFGIDSRCIRRFALLCLRVATTLRFCHSGAVAAGLFLALLCVAQSKVSFLALWPFFFLLDQALREGIRGAKLSHGDSHARCARLMTCKRRSQMKVLARGRRIKNN